MQQQPEEQEGVELDVEVEEVQPSEVFVRYGFRDLPFVLIGHDREFLCCCRDIAEALAAMEEYPTVVGAIGYVKTC